MELNLGNYYNSVISNAVMSGKYSSQNDVIRKALILLDREEKKILNLRRELELGEAEQTIENFDSYDFLDKIHQKYL
jgi:putative addiction module CopG family antidote